MRPSAIFTLSLASLWAFALPTAAQTVSGLPRVVDGDSLSVAGVSVRLFGIDAPELKQSCTRDGAPWACGEQAKAELQSLVEGKEVRCDRQTTDTFGRAVSICYADGEDIGMVMVQYGWAVAFTRYSPKYEGQQAQAKTARLGIWGSEFELPQNYRARKRLTEDGAAAVPAAQSTPRPARVQQFRAANGCLIKGNRNRKGEWIYHLPGMPYYDQTRAEEMFCTEAEAQAAGYRRAIVK